VIATRRGPHTKQSVIRRVQREYEALDRVIRSLARGGLDRPVPGFGARARVRRERWTYKDTLAHILFWKQWQMETIAHRPHAEKPQGLTVHDENRWIYQRSHKRSARAVIAWHRRLQREVLEALRAAPSATFTAKLSGQWPYDLDGHVAAHRKRHLEAR
jgi:hypothetical protein